jgi:hypothetical protein
VTTETAKALAEATRDVRQSAERVESAIVEQALALGGIQEQVVGARADVVALGDTLSNTMSTHVGALPDAMKLVLDASLGAVGAEFVGLRSDVREQLANVRRDLVAIREDAAQTRAADREIREETAAHASRLTGVVRESAAQITAGVQEGRQETSALLRQLASLAEDELQHLAAVASTLTARSEQSGRTGQRTVAVLEDVQKEIRGLRGELAVHGPPRVELPSMFRGGATNGSGHGASNGPGHGVSLPPIKTPGTPSVADEARNGAARAK